MSSHSKGPEAGFLGSKRTSDSNAAHGLALTKRLRQLRTFHPVSPRPRGSARGPRGASAASMSTSLPEGFLCARSLSPRGGGGPLTPSRVAQGHGCVNSQAPWPLGGRVHCLPEAPGGLGSGPHSGHLVTFHRLPLFLPHFPLPLRGLLTCP